MSASVPPLVRLLGYGAWQQMLCNYGAVILSFVGALHWGFAMGSLAGALLVARLSARSSCTSSC